MLQGGAVFCQSKIQKPYAGLTKNVRSTLYTYNYAMIIKYKGDMYHDENKDNEALERE